MLTQIPAHSFSKAEWASIQHLKRWISDSLMTISSVDLCEILAEHFGGSLANVHYFIDSIGARDQFLLFEEVRLLKNLAVGVCNALVVDIDAACGLTIDLLDRELDEHRDRGIVWREYILDSCQ